ncbi:MAG: radical SAM protein [Theionarchaea archaeon]|nr:radical SAM protein [Theionarchaea archaeon]MBU7000954.1 radical SAM protein [Theionarchaea archaeon]MBU7021105.1 radical SAM protein [Theionarchaea archaeon]MBU7039901.1 radical SAM protein [Theionarchaea archaeon]
MYASTYNSVIPMDSGEAVLFNSLSGALFVLDRRIASAIGRGDCGSVDNSILQYLKKDNILYDSIDDEKAHVSFTAEMVKKSQESERIRYHVVPTLGCNISCSYCDRGGDRDSMSASQAAKVIEAIEYVEELTSGSHAPLLILDGGEPLSLQEEVRESCSTLLDLADERDFHVAFRTNGVTLSEYAADLTQYYVEYVDVPVDGTKSYHDRRRRSQKGGTFDDIVTGIETALDCGLQVNLRLQVSSHNLMEAPAMAEFIMDKTWHLARNFRALLCPLEDFSCYGFRTCRPDYSILKDVLELYQAHAAMELFTLTGFFEISSLLYLLESGVSLRPRLSPCDAGKALYCFDPYNTIYPCVAACMMRTSPVGMYQPEMTVFPALDQWRTRSVFTVDSCLSCPFCFVCGGGCTLQATTHGAVTKPQCRPVDTALQLACAEYLSENRARESSFIYFDNIFIPKKEITFP